LLRLTSILSFGLWVADITYVPTWAGFLYLAIVFEALKSPCERLEYTAVEFRSARLRRAIPNRGAHVVPQALPPQKDGV